MQSIALSRMRHGRKVWRSWCSLSPRGTWRPSAWRRHPAAKRSLPRSTADLRLSCYSVVWAQPVTTCNVHPVLILVDHAATSTTEWLDIYHCRIKSVICKNYRTGRHHPEINFCDRRFACVRGYPCLESDPTSPSLSTVTPTDALFITLRGWRLALKFDDLRRAVSAQRRNSNLGK